MHGHVVERMKALLASTVASFGHGVAVRRSCVKLARRSRPPFTTPCVCCTSVAPTLRLPTSHLVEQEFAELNLKQISEQVGGVIRTRQHVNPLKASLMAPVSPPSWEDIFRNPSLPIIVDIGSGSGRFIMMLAKRNSESCNYLGLEIRHQLVSRANLWVDELKLRNLHFIFANATVSFGSILSTYPGPLKLVIISCPDPHFKTKHHKRRVVQLQLVDMIVNMLAQSGQVFLQSDVKEVAKDMRLQFNTKVGTSLVSELQANPSAHDTEGWLLENPLGLRSEREIHAISTGGQMYRNLYTKL